MTCIIDRILLRISDTGKHDYILPQIVSVEERAEVESARLEKMRAVSEKLLKADRREVWTSRTTQAPLSLYQAIYVFRSFIRKQ